MEKGREKKKYIRKWKKNERRGERKSCEGRKMRRLRDGGRRGNGESVGKRKGEERGNKGREKRERGRKRWTAGKEKWMNRKSDGKEGREEGIDGWGGERGQRNKRGGDSWGTQRLITPEGSRMGMRGWERQGMGTEQGWRPRMGLKEPGMGKEQRWGQNWRRMGMGSGMGTGGNKGWG